jgi:hypothetical protein
MDGIPDKGGFFPSRWVIPMLVFKASEAGLGEEIVKLEIRIGGYVRMDNLPDQIEIPF